MSGKNKNALIVLMMAAGAGLGVYWLVRRSSKGRLDIPGSKRVLSKRHGSARAKTLLQHAQGIYSTFLAEYPMPANPALRGHLKDSILPGLALYRVLLAEHGGDRQAALEEIEAVFTAWTYERCRVQLAPVKILPIPFWLFKQAARLQMRAFPAEGWDFQSMEDSNTRFAFNATRCFYLNTLITLGAPELTASFCKMDEVMADEFFPDSVAFIRPHTLGRGDPLCDFQYCLKTPAQIDAAPNQTLYHAFAPLYDRLFGATYAGARRRAVELLDPQPGERLLISGVGTGLDLPTIPAGVAVTGVDISAEMLHEAAKKSSPASVQLTQMDAQCLDFPAESFDAALLNLIVSVAPDGRAVFQEAWRVLKPGGRLVLFDKFLPEGQNVSLPRAALGSLSRWIGTDINRRLKDILGDLENGLIEMDEPSLLFGQYRILKIKKRDTIEGG